MKTATSPVISPTVGRVVWFYPDARTGESGFAQLGGAGPYAAVIAHVWNVGMVNLTVFDANGVPHGRTSVALLQDGVAEGDFCTWMPFQKGQAKAQEEKAQPDAVPAFAALQKALHSDPDYAWSWHCNFAMPIMDSSSLGHELANKSAAHLMRHIFGIDMTKHPHYQDLQEKWGAEPKSNVDALQACAETDIENQTFGFGAAIDALKRGFRIVREGWNGRGMFVYMVPAASYPVQTGAAAAHFGEGSVVPYRAYLALKTVDDTVSTWAPSVSDVLAEDWVVLESAPKVSA